MTTFFLIAAALLALLATAALVWPLLWRARAALPRSDYDLTVYRDQLAEIERDHQRGVLDAAEAEASRLEVQRRLLAADRRGAGEAAGAAAGAAAARRRDWFLPLVVGLLVPGLSLGGYLLLGRPDVPSVDFAQQQAAVSDMAGLAKQLRDRLAGEPDNTQGWELLGRTYLELDRPADAAEAFRTALAHGADRGRLNSELGEALVAAGQGRVGKEARAAFAQALQADSRDPRARYYAGLAMVQDGRGEEGLKLWKELAASSPPGAPWLPSLNQSIASLSAQLGQAPVAGGAPGTAPGPGMPGPSQQDVEAAGKLSDADRAAFIRSMVERLATRLKEEPGDIDGWLRLARARQVLGETDQAVEALRSAQKQLAGRPAGDAQRQSVEQALKALGQQP
ncbi:cytochrome c-type biogenesis protein CcmH [Tistlia consotensis]|uniref:Cytochrome c-type biogenesis protein CcmH n=1 Tax=Tistlia consotensis USBA 355 TaxID=560819 RepID=A0A1Y6BMW7_9PROT|nr:c-type cytochrome biogenesis protein CcmI [Tistlia consotensis]SMF11791.1 cytochrome c-type biogenesis protein CcmH [Tistlia consotensis USBA 355]SNR51655.1 cytochrome c-type biogenesis protein CcmH [Tistlia consotensis]